MAITTDRNVYLGIHVTQDIKDALREEADKNDPNRPSVSLVASLLLAQRLREKGYEIEEVPGEN